ncbi:MAG: DUF4270 family protein [Bacteroidetes bacterium]|nr:DUF4270 family protein [Bacteroidota bacterium]
MRPFSRAALYWVAALALLGGCKKPDVFDVGLNPPAQVGYLDSVKVELVTYVPPLDSLFTQNQSYMVLGSYSDPLLGRVNGEIYTQFSLGGEFVSFPENAVIDSVMLLLPLDSYYGKPTSTLQLEVNELTQAFDGSGGTRYFATSSLTYDPANLAGSYTYTHPADSFRFDTLRIRLADELGQRILDADVNGPLANNANFHQFFKGLRISAQPTSSADVGVMYTVALRNLLVTSNRAATLRLHYSVDGETRTPYNLMIQPSVSFRFNKLIRTETTGTFLERLEGREIPDSQLSAALQSVVPLRVRARIRNLPARPLAINRAILEIPVDTSAIDHNPYRYFRPIPNDLYLIPAESDSVTPDPFLGIEAYANYNNTLARYEFDISAYFHQVMQGTLPDYGFLLLPTPFAYSSRNSGGFLTQNIGCVQRSILHNWNHPDRKPRIRVHYTEIP